MCIAKTSAYIDFARDCISRDVKTLIQKGLLPPTCGKRSTMDVEQVRVYWCFMDWYPRMQADHQNHIFMNTKYLSRRNILIKRPVYKIPIEWLAIYADHTRIKLKNGFNFLLNNTRALRGRFGLRKIQWKKDITAPKS